ncbi:putative RNA recognition motif domain, nucleotide-binding alpha-beta plait domain superfamily [Helianthus anomalus]
MTILLIVLWKSLKLCGLSILLGKSLPNAERSQGFIFLKITSLAILKETVVVEDVVVLEVVALAVANQRPAKTMFIINFDPVHTRVRDIENHFEPYGNVLHVRIRRNFAFVQFETQEATKALECTHMRFSVPLNSPRRDYGRRRDSPYRSSSPYRRSRPSPDYGRARSLVYDRYSGPSYDRPKSPAYGRY